ncbi:FtsB family cell division protein [Treponema brennaborense]|uniref:Septum formation initiator n=1 Tax=Treponema brennaborense (strain DSM 12168 / CIP 105900 / DD5/3) TaxID=906968 RepID=F4LP80_TREBD|nr:septum formation initiator family protein [Treponema brennaborense]AEE16942.1 Septum formation initiator [Treponema brennaborense DSM 12168]
MLRLKVLISICAGTLVYVLASFFGGQDGLWAMHQLELQKQDISVRVAEIAKINEELLLEYMALKQDPDVIAAYARKLGYVSEGEKLVKISGLAPQYTPLYNAGVLLKSSPVSFIPEWVCKLFGLLVGTLTFVLLLLKHLAKTPRHRETCEKEIFTAGVKAPRYESIAGIPVETI